MQATSLSATGVEGVGYRPTAVRYHPTAFRSRDFCVARNENGNSERRGLRMFGWRAARVSRCAEARARPRRATAPRHVFKDVPAHGAGVGGSTPQSFSVIRGRFSVIRGNFRAV